MSTAIERDFPFWEISVLAEHESWRKEIYSPLTHTHKWWAVRLGSVFKALLLGALLPSQEDIPTNLVQLKGHYRNKIVLDPFMGSGTTLVEAWKLGLKAIGNDINPISTFIVRSTFASVEPERLKKSFAYLEQAAGNAIRSYYVTLDDAGEEIPVLYYFWVKEITTPNGERIPLFSKFVFAKHAYPKKHPTAQILCPKCWQVFSDRYDTSDTTCPHCGYRFNPQRGPARGAYVTDSGGRKHKIVDLLIPHKPPKHRLYALLAVLPNGEKAYRSITQFDLLLYNKAAERLQTEDLPLPTGEVIPGRNTNQARRYGYLLWRDFFNERQLLSLGLLLKAILSIRDKTSRDQMLLLFSSILEYNNMFCSYKGEGTGAVRPLFSRQILKPERTPLENSVWGWPQSSGTFSTMFESRLLRAKNFLSSPTLLLPSQNGARPRKVTLPTKPLPTLVSSWEEMLQTPNALWILNGDSAHLPIPDKSIDAIVTDPPYFDYVHYSELADFFYAWLSPVLQSEVPYFRNTSSRNERAEVQHSEPKQFAQRLARVFIEAKRVLKPQGVLVFTFHHSHPTGWAAVSTALVKAGFQVVAAYPVHGEIKVALAKSAAKSPIHLDSILVCKPNEKKERLITIPKALELAHSFIHRYEQKGKVLSEGDKFVIKASQMLRVTTSMNATFQQAKEILAFVLQEEEHLLSQSPQQENVEIKPWETT